MSSPTRSPAASSKALQAGHCKSSTSRTVTGTFVPSSPSGYPPSSVTPEGTAACASCWLTTTTAAMIPTATRTAAPSAPLPSRPSRFSCRSAWRRSCAARSAAALRGALSGFEATWCAPSVGSASPGPVRPAAGPPPRMLPPPGRWGGWSGRPGPCVRPPARERRGDDRRPAPGPRVVRPRGQPPAWYLVPARSCAVPRVAASHRGGRSVRARPGRAHHLGEEARARTGQAAAVSPSASYRTPVRSADASHSAAAVSGSRASCVVAARPDSPRASAGPCGP